MVSLFDALESDGLLIDLASADENALSATTTSDADTDVEAGPATSDGAMSIDGLGTNPDEVALEGPASFVMSFIAPGARLS